MDNLGPTYSHAQENLGFTDNGVSGLTLQTGARTAELPTAEFLDSAAKLGMD